MDGTSLFASGGLWILAGIEGSWRFSESGMLWLHVETPLARNLQTPTLEANAKLTIGVSLEF